jgi:ankyrin repeat protein
MNFPEGLANFQGFTELHFAAYNGFTLEVCEILNNTDVDINMPGGLGITALHLSAQNGNVETTEYLLKQPQINVFAKTEHPQKTALDLVTERLQSPHITDYKLLADLTEIQVLLENAELKEKLQEQRKQEER